MQRLYEIEFTHKSPHYLGNEAIFTKTFREAAILQQQVPEPELGLLGMVHGSQLPALVSKAGTLGKQVTPPSEVMADTFSPDSYWWLFRQLHDRVKGDPIKSYPNH